MIFNRIAFIIALISLSFISTIYAEMTESQSNFFIRQINHSPFNHKIEAGAMNNLGECITTYLDQSKISFDREPEPTIDGYGYLLNVIFSGFKCQYITNSGLILEVNDTNLTDFSGFPVKINQIGTMVGITPGVKSAQLFTWNPNKGITLITPPPETILISPCDMNDSNEIVGYTIERKDQEYSFNLFLVNDQGWNTLYSLQIPTDFTEPGYVFEFLKSKAYINNQGKIAAQYWDFENLRATIALWQKKEVISKDITSSNSLLHYELCGFNNHGDILYRDYGMNSESNFCIWSEHQSITMLNLPEPQELLSEQLHSLNSYQESDSEEVNLFFLAKGFNEKREFLLEAHFLDLEKQLHIEKCYFSGEKLLDLQKHFAETFENFSIEDLNDLGEILMIGQEKNANKTEQNLYIATPKN
ncbi:MAG: hypothetical protein Tsb0021_08670 [Chlamydiales bacterium]